MSYGERLEAAMRHAGISRTALANAMGISAQAVFGVIKGGTRAMTAENNFKAAETLGVSALWLATGKGQMVDGDPQPEFAGHPRKARRVPVVGTAKMGEDGFFDEFSEMPGAGDGHIEIATEDPNAYCLRVKGQSMFPAIRDNWYVLIEPNGTPREGEYVLLKLLDGRKMVKELLFRRGNAIEVMSVNGGERLSFELSELDGMQPVGAVVSPSKWRPD